MYNMSDSEGEQPQVISLEDTLARFNSSKGSGIAKGLADRRKETSKANMAKARAAKIAKLKQKKEEESRQIEVDPETDEYSEQSSSDDELYIKKSKRNHPTSAAKKRSVVVRDDDTARRMEAIEMAVLSMLKDQKKVKKKPVRKTVIQLPPASQPIPIPQPNRKVEVLKHNILDF